jgi:hypothetical protein
MFPGRLKRLGEECHSVPGKGGCEVWGPGPLVGAVLAPCTLLLFGSLLQSKDGLWHHDTPLFDAGHSCRRIENCPGEETT